MGKKLSAYNLHMKRELKGKMKGKTKAQRKAIFKAAARAWKSKKRGNPKPRSKPKSGGSSRSSSKTGGRRLGKSTFNMNKIYGAVRKIAIFVPAVDIAMRPISTEGKIKHGVLAYFGWNMWTHKFELHNLLQGWGPAIGAQVVTRVIPAVGKFIRSFF